MKRYLRKIEQKVDNRLTTFRERIYVFCLSMFYKKTASLRKYLLRNFSINKITQIERLLREHDTSTILAPMIVLALFLIASGHLTEKNVGNYLILALVSLLISVPTVFAITALLRITLKDYRDQYWTDEILRNNAIDGNTALYLRRFSFDRSVRLNTPEFITDWNNTSLIYGAVMGQTIDGVFTRALGTDSKIVKMASDTLDSLGVTTIQFEVGDTKWRSSFREICSKAKIIFVLPLVTRESALFEEIQFLKANGFLYKSVFLMPTQGHIALEGRYVTTSEIWDSSRTLIYRELQVELPKFQNAGGLIQLRGNKAQLASWVGGRAWFSKRVLRNLVDSQKIQISAFRFLIHLGKDIGFIVPLFSTLLITVLVFVIAWLFFGIEYLMGYLPESTTSSIKSSIEGTQIKGPVFFVPASMIFLLCIWGAVRRFFCGYVKLLAWVTLPAGWLFSYLVADKVIHFFDLSDELLLVLFTFILIGLNYLYILTMGFFLLLLNDTGGILPNNARIEDLKK